MPEISRFLGIVIANGSVELRGNWTTLAEEGIFNKIAPLV